MKGKGKFKEQFQEYCPCPECLGGPKEKLDPDCPRCHGEGAVVADTVCPACCGTGKGKVGFKYCRHCHGEGIDTDTGEECTFCDEGKIEVVHPCSKCNGTGEITN